MVLVSYCLKCQFGELTACANFRHPKFAVAPAETLVMSWKFLYLRKYFIGERKNSLTGLSG